MKRVYFVKMQQYDQMMNVYGPQKKQKKHLPEFVPFPYFTSGKGHLMSVMCTHPFAGSEGSWRRRRRGPKGGAATIVVDLPVAIGTPLLRYAFAFARRRPPRGDAATTCAKP